jgi:hypothetical protein
MKTRMRGVQVVAVFVALAAAPPAAQERQGPRPGEVESDPIKCWWKTDTTAVQVGERFTVVLTCGVIETGPIKVVPAANQLEAGAIQVTPFEVVSGSRRDDIVVPPWRYMQFEYVVRLMNDGFFGQDVNLPALTVTYSVQSAGGAQGREQGYVLPALPMRILSVVPRVAADIRDASDETFASIESRRFRATAATVAAWIFFAFAGVLTLVGVLRTTTHLRARESRAARPLPAPSLLGGVARTLRDVGDEAARGGWTPELARRALAALRVAGAVALDRGVTQTFAANGDPAREGQIPVRTGWLRRRRAFLSAPTTSKLISSRLQNGSTAGGRTRDSLQELADALQVFSGASYGRSDKADREALDEALQDGTRAVKRLRTGMMWPVRAATAMRSLFVN